MNVLLLSQKEPYDFVTDQGQQLTGVKIVFATGLFTGDAKGLQIIEKNLPLSLLKDLKALKDIPCICDIKSEMTYNSRGKLVEKVNSIEYVSPVTEEAFTLGVF